MDRRQALAIAAGGIVGAAVRWAILTVVASDGLVPWPVLVLNVSGSVALGALMAEESAHPRARLWLHDFGGIGFCGGLTTFSTFTFEIVELIRHDEAVVAMFYGASSVILSIAGVLVGAAVLHRVRAAGLPLEERP